VGRDIARASRLVGQSYIYDKVEVPKPARIRSFGASSRGFAINSRTGVLANGFQRC
jgi:hypothetical protein